MANEIATARYIYSDISQNNNKFWNATLYDDGNFKAEWGRVGESPQSRTWGGGKTKFDAKCREKEKKGYVRQQVLSNVSPSATARISSKEELANLAVSQVETNNDLVKALLRRLAQANVHAILAQTSNVRYDESKGTFSTPLGIINAQAIAEARQELNTIATLVAAQDWENRSFMNAINRLLMLVPQDIGRAKPTAQRLFPNASVVQAKNDLLDALEASLNSVLTNAGSNDSSDASVEAPKLFDLKLHLIEDGAEMDRIRKKYRDTRHHYHSSSSLDVKRAYTVTIGPMLAAFEEKGKPLGNVVEYWHGTKLHNVLSILTKGLQVVPPSTASIAGKMFGHGVYFSDQSTKSLNYATGAAPGQYGGWDGGATYMFLADVAMGKTHIASDDKGSWPKSGTDSTTALGGKCYSTYIGSTLKNNEFVVYANHQVNLTRLVEFTPGGR